MLARKLDVKDETNSRRGYGYKAKDVDEAESIFLAACELQGAQDETGKDNNWRREEG